MLSVSRDVVQRAVSVIKMKLPDEAFNLKQGVKFIASVLVVLVEIHQTST